MISLSVSSRNRTGDCEWVPASSVAEAESQFKNAAKGTHVLPAAFEGGCGYFKVTAPSAQLAVGTLQNALDELLRAFAGSSVDYIHGEDVTVELGGKSGEHRLPPAADGEGRILRYDCL